jgi:hypothetical protein
MVVTAPTLDTISITKQPQDEVFLLQVGLHLPFAEGRGSAARIDVHMMMKDLPAMTENGIRDWLVRKLPEMLRE